MRIAAGFKAHLGWAAIVVIGASDDDFRVIERRRIELGKSAGPPRGKDQKNAALAAMLVLKNRREG